MALCKIKMGSYTINVFGKHLILSRADFKNINEEKSICVIHNPSHEFCIHKMYTKHNRDIKAINYFLNKTLSEDFYNRLTSTMLKVDSMNSGIKII